MTQTIQGVDRLAINLNALILMPGFFEGEAARVNNVPPNTEDEKARLAKFRDGKLKYPLHLEMLQKVMTEAGKKDPSVPSWVIHGLCWGEKLAALASREGTVFRISGQVNPR